MTTPAPPPEADACDDVLLDRIADGDVTALATLYDRCGQPAFALARRIVGDPDLAQDVVQEAFMVPWRNPTTTRTVGGSRTAGCWRSRTGWRSKRYAGSGARAPAPASAEEAARYRARPSGDDLAGSDPRGHRARQALGALPPPQRQALMLAYFAGYTQREIAEHTASGLDPVRSRMVDGVRELRARLHGAFEAEGVRP